MGEGDEEGSGGMDRINPEHNIREKCRCPAQAGTENDKKKESHKQHHSKHRYFDFQKVYVCLLNRQYLQNPRVPSRPEST